MKIALAGGQADRLRVLEAEAKMAQERYSAAISILAMGTDLQGNVSVTVNLTTADPHILVESEKANGEANGISA